MCWKWTRKWIRLLVANKNGNEWLIYYILSFNIFSIGLVKCNEHSQSKLFWNQSKKVLKRQFVNFCCSCLIDQFCSSCCRSTGYCSWKINLKKKLPLKYVIFSIIYHFVKKFNFVLHFFTNNRLMDNLYQNNEKKLFNGKFKPWIRFQLDQSNYNPNTNKKNVRNPSLNIELLCNH